MFLEMNKIVFFSSQPFKQYVRISVKFQRHKLDFINKQNAGKWNVKNF